MSVSEVRNTGLEDDVAPTKKGRIMNYDKQLAKYARHLDNPKNFGKIRKILEAAERHNYKFKMFNDYDIYHIVSEACTYYDAVPTDEEDKRMIHYFNKACFLISDKNYILCITEGIFEALWMYFKMKIVMTMARIKQFFRPDLLITMGNVNNDMYLCRGALNAAKVLNADVFELEKYFA